MEKDEKRIYGKMIDIPEDKVKQFWNGRAKKYNETNPYLSVKLGDKNPERAKLLDGFEKLHILPLLDITKSDNVMDIGCGIGRLAELIIPKCNYYLGTDYAVQLIDIAKKRIKYTKKNYTFLNIAFQDISKDNGLIIVPEGGYSAILIAGVLQYINDIHITTGLCNILPFTSKHCRIYITSPISVSERLTLKEFYSTEIETDYSNIYRTQNEYWELYAPLRENGFSLKLQGEIPVDIGGFSETHREYHIFERE